MKLKLFILCSLFFSMTIFAQDGLPTDYLSADFHKERRAALRAKMADNSVAVFFANPVRNRANDVDYVYHQDPNFYYLTGYKEPHAVLVVFKDNQTDDKGNTYNEILYVQERNAQAEQWTGRRLGIEGAKNQLGFDVAYNGSEFANSGIDYSAFNKVMFNNFNNDYRDSKRDKADLYSLVESFKTQVNFDESVDEDPIKKRVYEMIKATEVENSANVAQMISRAFEQFPDLENDEVIAGYVNATDDKTRIELKQQVIKIELEAPKSNLDTKSLSTIMASLRQLKTEEEMVLLNKAVRISAMGQREIMKAMHPGMSETEVQGIHEYVYKKYGSEYEGYPSIVGAGNNGCVLHYIENTKMKLENDLVLMDLGAEYHGYTADVTRTIPANGKFTPEQKAVYDIVYDAQEAGIAASTVGAPFRSVDAASRKVVNEGLVRLGIVKTVDEARQYFPHGTSHYLGLDVHDPGDYGDLQANMVITVEPGIYIPDGSPCDEKWWGIAVRIEDDILITDKGPVNLSAEAPRKSDEIEALMKEKSALDDFVLPKLD
ncbi:aminopeptidase P N-terminal domain-containing protein [Hanstruepera ponticola]|uniref:aminopeptidase P N-terminal domain-containing protein n=1 Tax=Hanstruepera ponticola TaxID=2042995 RepID=UPI000CF04C26|nr:aminopeptidase P N-terminal domain-containing protein [Hanstruepera ponticola]